MSSHKEFLHKNLSELLGLVMNSGSSDQRAMFMIAYKVNFNKKDLDEVLGYINSQVFKTYDYSKMRLSIELLYNITTTAMNIKMLEKIFNDKELISNFKNFLIDIWNSTSSLVSFSANIMLQKAEYNKFYESTLELIQFWADITLFYQGDFPILHGLYKLMREKAIKFPERNFDDLRVVQINIPLIQEIPILALDMNFIGEKAWSLKMKSKETVKVMGALITLFELLDDKKEKVCKNESKITYLYQYLLNVRSRWNHELRMLVKKQDTKETMVEEQKKGLDDLSEGVKFSKNEMDKYGFDTKGKPAEKNLRWEEDQGSNEDEPKEIKRIDLGKIDEVVEWYKWEEQEQQQKSGQKMESILEMLQGIEIK